MIKIVLLMGAAVILSAMAAAVVIRTAGPSTKDLEADISATSAEIAEADAEAARYSGGILKIEADLRASILRNTLAMLEQKRDAFLRGITLVYQDPTPRLKDPADEASTLSELKQAESEAAMAHLEASRYSGGLIQTMALMREATARMTAATIKQRIALRNIGIPLSYVSGAVPSKTNVPGKPALDKDAL